MKTSPSSLLSKLLGAKASPIPKEAATRASGNLQPHMQLSTDRDEEDGPEDILDDELEELRERMMMH